MEMLTFRSAASVESLMSTCAMNNLTFKLASRPADETGLRRAREMYGDLKLQARRALTLDQVRRLLLVCQAAIDGHLDRGSKLEVDGSGLTDTIDALEAAE